MKKKKQVRLNPADSICAFADMLDVVEDNGLENHAGKKLQFRPRSRREDWENVPVGHLFNQELYNYRWADLPRIRLDGQRVILDDEEERPLGWVKRIIAIARRCRRSKKGIAIRAGCKDGDPGRTGAANAAKFTVVISSAGGVEVGCRHYTWAEIEGFEGEYLRK